MSCTTYRHRTWVYSVWGQAVYEESRHGTLQYTQSALKHCISQFFISLYMPALHNNLQFTSQFFYITQKTPGISIL
jgi:hypothetical protein